MQHDRLLSRLALAGALTLTAGAGAAQAVEISFFRFFGECQAEYGSVNTAAEANGECGIITALANQFAAENTLGATVATQIVDWGAYYDLLTATYSTGSIPDVAVMHGSVLPNFAERGLLMPLGPVFAEAGIDTADFVPAALANATSGGEVYALPYDLHALLWHVNMDLMAEAGLVNPDGTPILPTSPEELIAQGRQFKERTGKFYLASESQAAEGMMVRFWQSLMWQQGVDVLSADGKTASIDTPEGLTAADLVKAMYDEGLVNPALDYAGAEQAFLNGEAGIIMNGTWVVDSYDTQARSGEAALKNYRVANLPTLFGTPAVWADSHMWVIPADPSRSPEETAAAVAFIKFLNDNSFQWSRTGHLSVRQSVIDSPEFASLPHRTEYAETATRARALPPAQNQRAIFNAMFTDFNAIWLTGTEPADALAAMQASVEQILRRNR